jgi:hypothetical protein
LGLKYVLALPQVENPPKSRLHQQQRKSIQGERENFVNPNEGKEEIEGLLAMQDLAAMDRVSFIFYKINLAVGLSLLTAVSSACNRNSAIQPAPNDHFRCFLFY